jgi:hypothetical protein
MLEASVVILCEGNRQRYIGERDEESGSIRHILHGWKVRM